jgi:subtilisin family serine protease
VDGTTRGTGHDAFEAVFPRAWFVELESAPLAETAPSTEPRQRIQIRKERQAFRSSLLRAGIRAKERYAFELLWNGISLEVAPEKVLALTRVPGAKAVYPVGASRIPDPERVPLSGGAAPDLLSAIAMTGADRAQASGVTGAGVRVGIIDTGIDYRHPDLGGGFGPGFKVEGGFDLVGDFYLGSGTTPIPDPDPLDCAGHGTHVAGIVGADGGVRGVAPGASLRAYRVFGCFGGTEDDVILAAMERAAADGCQVVNLSLGTAFQWPQYPTARGAENLVRRGVVVVASAGNVGEAGPYATGAPAVGRKVIAAASVDNERVHARAFSLPDGTLVGYLPIGNALEPPLSGTALLSDARTGCNFDRGSLLGIQGRIALLARGGCAVREKLLNARNAGALAAVVYNDEPGIFSASAGNIPILIPAVSIARQDALAALPRLPMLMTWTAGFTDAPNANAGLVSSFSSSGPSPDLSLKPDVAAPGGRVFSTFPLGLGQYALFSGTSMAAPQVSGAAALLLEARPHAPPAAVRELLMTTAAPQPPSGAPAAGFLESLPRQGAGLVNVAAALASGVRVSPVPLLLGELEGNPKQASLLLENESEIDVTYDLTHAPALALEPVPFEAVRTPRAAQVEFRPPAVSIPAGGTATVEVDFTEPGTVGDGGLFGGFLTLTPRGEGETIRVPYLGVKGDYQSIAAMPPTFSGLDNPMLRQIPEPGPSGPAVFRPADGLLPFLLFHIQHPVRRLRFEVFEDGTGRAFGRVGDFLFFPRNRAENEFYFVVWDGHDRDGDPVPEGVYRVRITVQKSLGEDANPAHFESWTSPPITVDR